MDLKEKHPLLEYQFDSIKINDVVCDPRESEYSWNWNSILPTIGDNHPCVGCKKQKECGEEFKACNDYHRYLWRHGMREDRNPTKKKFDVIEEFDMLRTIGYAQLCQMSSKIQIDKQIQYIVKDKIIQKGRSIFYIPIANVFYITAIKDESGNTHYRHIKYKEILEKMEAEVDA